MLSINCLTTLKLTSASSSAMRISRRALSMFSAESLPSPRRFLNTRCNLSDRLSNMKIDQPRKGIRVRHLGGFLYYSLLFRGRRSFRRRDAQAACRHLPGAIHAQFIEHPRTRAKVCGQTFREAGDVEEDVPSAVIGAQEAEALGFEIRHHASALFAGGGFARCVSGGCSRCHRPAGFIADPL